MSRSTERREDHFSATDVALGVASPRLFQSGRIFREQTPRFIFKERAASRSVEIELALSLSGGSSDSSDSCDSLAVTSNYSGAEEHKPEHAQDQYREAGGDKQES